MAERSALIVCSDQIEMLASLLNISSKIGVSSPVLVIDSDKHLKTKVNQQIYHLNTTTGILREDYMLKSVHVTNTVAEYREGRFIAVSLRSFLQRRSNFSGIALDLVSVQQIPHLYITHDYDPKQGCYSWNTEIVAQLK